jgi:aminoglycoside phosphotransferase (APT) family kinase protein
VCAEDELRGSVDVVPDWSADLDVDSALVERLLRSQFPEVDAGSLALLGEGWDNTVWLVEDRWVFRFPRRQIAVPAVARQVAILPRLARILPLPVPTPVFAGRPADDYPWPFFGAEFLPGQELAGASVSESALGGLARRLGTFLRALHEVEPAAVGADALPIDPMGRADMRVRVPVAATVLAEVEGLGLWSRPPSVDAVLADAASLPPPTRLAVTHGDLHLRHLLVDEAGSAAGVIDWDDLCRGDPAIDLVPFWSVIPSQARGEFLEAYGGAREDQLLRARVLAFFLGATLAKYAAHERLPGLQSEAVASLSRAAVG